MEEERLSQQHYSRCRGDGNGDREWGGGISPEAEATQRWKNIDKVPSGKSVSISHSFPPSRHYQTLEEGEVVEEQDVGMWGKAAETTATEREEIWALLANGNNN